jgi:photosystem II stability/assembly factor-like uncharacterized protein
VEAPPTATSVPPTETPTESPAIADVISHLSAGEAITITTLKMLDANIGWAVGQSGTDTNDRILQTADGGATWRDLTPAQPLDPIASLGQAAAVFFLDEAHAWVTYYDRTANPESAPATVWRTSDSGGTWAVSDVLEISEGTADFHQVSDLAFVDANTGWALMHLGVGLSHDYVAVFGTTDGGATWETFVDPNADGGLAMSCGKTGFAFADAKTGWVLGDCGGVVPGTPYFYQTNDGGRTWQTIELPSPTDKADLFDPNNFDYACGTNWMRFTSATDGAVVVRCSEFSSSKSLGWLYTTADAGATWASAALPGSYNNSFYIVGAQFLDGQRGWILSDGDAGGGQLQATADGGQTWSLVKKLGWIGQLQFIDANTGWAIAQATDATALVMTTDGGGKWKELKPVIAP